MRIAEPDKREVASMEALLVDKTRVDEDELVLDNYTMPEMDRYDRLYLDSLPWDMI